MQSGKWSYKDYVWKIDSDFLHKFLFLPTQCCASVVLAMALHLSVCHSQVFYRNGCMDQAEFFHRSFALLILRSNSNWFTAKWPLFS